MGVSVSQLMFQGPNVLHYVSRYRHADWQN